MNLSRGAMRLLRRLRDLSRSHQGAAFAFQKTLARWFEVTVRTVQYWVAELRKNGLIQVKQRGSPTETRRAALYVIDEKLADKICAPGFVRGFGPEYERPITEATADLRGKAPAPPVHKPPQPEKSLSRRILDILWRKRHIIAAAKFPGRYRQAIIDGEQAKEETELAEVEINWQEPGAYEKLCAIRGKLA